MSKGADEPAKILGTSRCGCTNWNSVGVAQAKENLKTGILEAVQKANGNLSQVIGIGLGMSGVDRPADKEQVTGWMKEILFDVPHENIIVQSDAVAALASGTSGHLYGLVVISGTGMICYGFNNQKKEKRSGGWGPLLGDEGSGYAIAQDILKAVVQAHDGRGIATMLVQEVLDQLHLKTCEELISWAYDEKDRSWSKFADLSPLAAKCAAKGDAVALNILDHAAEQLLITIGAVVSGLEMENEKFPLVLAGGNLTHQNSKLAHLLHDKAKSKYPNVDILYPSIDPAHAACLLVINKLNLPL